MRLQNKQILVGKEDRKNHSKVLREGEDKFYCSLDSRNDRILDRIAIVIEIILDGILEGMQNGVYDKVRVRISISNREGKFNETFDREREDLLHSHIDRINKRKKKLNREIEIKVKFDSTLYIRNDRITYRIKNRIK